MDIIKEEAGNACLSAGEGLTNLDNKIVLAIAIRLVAEQIYKVAKIKDKAFAGSIYFESNTGAVYTV